MEEESGYSRNSIINWEPGVRVPRADILAELAKLLHISDTQMSYITNADAGCGLIKYGSALVPFVNRFPKDTELYQLMTTKPGEGHFFQGQV